jgi:hypothetical protein
LVKGVQEKVTSFVKLHTDLLTDESTIKREYGVLEAIPDHYEIIIVSLDDLKLPNKKGIKHVQTWNLHTYLMN